MEPNDKDKEDGYEEQKYQDLEESDKVQRITQESTLRQIYDPREELLTLEGKRSQIANLIRK